MIGIVTLAPTRFIRRFMGGPARMYPTLFDDQHACQHVNIEEDRFFLLSDGQRY